MPHVKLSCGIRGVEEAPRPFLRTDTLLCEPLLAYTGLRVQSQADAGQLPRMEGRLGIGGPWSLAPASGLRPTYTPGRRGDSVQGSCVPGIPMARSK